MKYEIMLAACRNDQDELLKEMLNSDDVDYNFVDGIGDGALHYAAKYGSLSCLELLVTLKAIDLNMRDRIDLDTPLHKAVQYKEDGDIAIAMVDQLLEAGADPRIENRAKMTPPMLVNPNDEDMKELFDQAMAAYEVDDSDIADDEYPEDIDDDQLSE
ncbi:ankyrin [Lichtheimia hyalospora FSU 10163]|nr:ankyrin [Lichtheimia hyalospora FSU 10163]